MDPDALDNNYDASQAGSVTPSAVPSSSNGLDFNSILGSALNAAPGVVNALVGKPTTGGAAPAGSTAVKPTTSLSNVQTAASSKLPWIIGGLVALGLLVFVFFEKK